MRILSLSGSPPSYSQLLRHRAWELSKEHFAWTFPLLAGVVTFLLQWRFGGWEEAADSVVGSLYSVGAAVAIAILVYGLNILRSASALHDEQLAAIEKLGREVYEAKAALETRRRNKALADALKALDERAVHELWAVSSYVVPKYFSDVDAWTQDVLDAIQHFGGTDEDLRHVRTLGNLAHEPKYHSDPKIDQYRRMINVRRQRMQQVIRRYDPDAY